MKKILNMFLVLALLMWLGAFFPGCGHSQDLTIFTEEISSDDPQVIPDEKRISSGMYAISMVDGIARDMLIISADMIESMGFITMVKLTGSPSRVMATKGLNSDLEFMYLAVQHLDAVGGSMSANGMTVFVTRDSTHCALYSTLDIEYDSYRVGNEVPLNGSGQARIIISSYACKFFENIHIDVILTGEFTSKEQSFEELIFKADFEPGKGIDINVKSAEILYENGVLYCFQYIDHTTCFPVDLRDLTDYCSPASDACEVSSAGHEGCMSAEYEETGAHCNLGCCAPLPSEANVCNGEAYAQRDCNPATESLYSDTYLLWGEKLMTYEVPLRCSDDGLWTPPCVVDGSYDVCPYGGTCVPPDDEGWGVGLEEYGYCSCTSQ